MNQDIVLNGGARPASKLAALARKATDAQLGFAIQDQLFGHDAEAEEAARVFADYYRLAARHDGEAVLDDDALAALRAQGRSATHIRKLELLVKHNTGCNALSNAQLKLQLKEYGLPFSEGYADVDRRIVLSGWADAQAKAAAYNTPQSRAIRRQSASCSMRRVRSSQHRRLSRKLQRSPILCQSAEAPATFRQARRCRHTAAMPSSRS